jgi:hypothetical protein
MDTNENLPIPEQQGETTRITARFSSVYVGAVPPPEILDAYERHLPGATTRFIELVENEQKMQFAIANRNLDQQDRGLDQRERELDLQNRELDRQERELRLRGREEANNSTNFLRGLIASAVLMSIFFAFMFVCAFLRLENVLIYALGVPVLTALGGIVGQFIWKRKK